MKNLLIGLALAIPTVLQAQVADTSYTVGPDQGSSVGIYPHYYRLTRRDSTLGVVLQGNANAGSCANAWCALVPSRATNGMGQSGGKFPSFNDAAHEVVRVWNSLHPGDTLSIPVVTPPPPKDTVGYDTTYVQNRVTCVSSDYKTCYTILQNDQEIGWVRQKDTTITRRWVAGRGVVAFSPWYTTLKAAARRLVDDWHITYFPPTPTDTVHKTIFVYDTVRTTITITVTKYDTTRVPITVYDTTHVPVVVKDSTKPELPRFMKEMDSMIESARAADTITRRIVDLVGKSLVPRVDSLGRPLCSKIIRFDSAGTKWERPTQFPCQP